MSEAETCWGWIKSWLHSETREKYDGKRRRPERRKMESRQVEGREKRSAGNKQTRDGMGMAKKKQRAKETSPRVSNSQLLSRLTFLHQLPGSI